MPTIWPRPFPRGGTWAVVSPSAPLGDFPRQRLDAAVEWFRARGERVLFSPYLRDLHGHSAGTAARRAEEMRWAFTAPGIDGVMALWGGYTSNQLLPLLDYEAIAAARRPFCGYSDVTALQAALLRRAGLVTLYGPAFCSFCYGPPHPYTVAAWDQMVYEGAAAVEIGPAETCGDYGGPLRPNPGWTVLRPGRAEGRLVAGELTTLALLCGTPYMPDTAGAILVLESDETTNPPTYDRLLHQLEQSGALAAVAGLAFGRSPAAAGITTATLGAMVDALRLPPDAPVAADLDIGHILPLATLPVGGRAVLDVDRGRLRMFRGLPV